MIIYGHLVFLHVFFLYKWYSLENNKIVIFNHYNKTTNFTMIYYFTVVGKFAYLTYLSVLARDYISFVKNIHVKKVCR